MEYFNVFRDAIKNATHAQHRGACPVALSYVPVYVSRSTAVTAKLALLGSFSSPLGLVASGTELAYRDPGTPLPPPRPPSPSSP